MIVVELEPGDVVQVKLRETDGTFEIDFCASESNRLRITSDMPGSVKGDMGVIYEEEWPEDLAPEKGGDERRVEDMIRRGVIAPMSVPKPGKRGEG